MRITIHQELYSSKNTRTFTRLKNGRTLLLKSRKAKEQEDTLETALKANFEQWKAMTKNKPYPLRVHFEVYRKTRRVWDWLNIIQGIADAMTQARYIPDDNTNFFTPVFDKAEYDKDDPRVIFWVE